MSAVVSLYTIEGLSASGGDPVASVSISPPSFQAGKEVTAEFIEHIRTFFAVQQNVATVVVTKVETVSTPV